MQSHDLVFTPPPIKEGDKTSIDSFHSDSQKDTERQDNLTELTVSKYEALEVLSRAKGMEKDLYEILKWKKVQYFLKYTCIQRSKGEIL